MNEIWLLVISNFIFQTGKSREEACTYIGRCYRKNRLVKFNKATNK